MDIQLFPYLNGELGTSRQ